MLKTARIVWFYCTRLHLKVFIHLFIHPFNLQCVAPTWRAACPPLDYHWIDACESSAFSSLWMNLENCSARWFQLSLRMPMLQGYRQLLRGTVVQIFEFHWCLLGFADAIQSDTTVFEKLARHMPGSARCCRVNDINLPMQPRVIKSKNYPRLILQLFMTFLVVLYFLFSLDVEFFTKHRTGNDYY